VAGESIHCIPDPVNCSHGSLSYSHGCLEPNNCGNCRTGCLPSGPAKGGQAMGDRSMGVQAMGVQATGAQPTHLARSSIQAWLPDGLIQKLIERMSAGASAKIFAIRHRCCCRCCECCCHYSGRAPIPNSNFLAFPDVRKNCSVDLWGAIQSSATQQRCSVPRPVPTGRSAETHCSNWCFLVSELRGRFQWTCHLAG
jgi:hypothetical protein